MQHHNLGDWVQYAMRGIVLTQLQQQVTSILDGVEAPLPIEQVNERVKQFEARHKLVWALRCGTP